ncbi:MAG: ribonuclease R [Bacteroidota bacterium]
MIIESIQKKILAFLARWPNELFKTKELARRTGFKSEAEYLQFKKALRELQDSNQIARHRGKMFGHLHVPQSVRGVLQVAKQGFGFVKDEASGEEIFIAPNLVGNAIHGDTVEVSLFAQNTKSKDRGSRREGEITSVLKRSRLNIVGTLELSKNAFLLSPDDRKMSRDVFVARHAVGAAKPGDKVVVEIESWGGNRLNPEGKVVEVLGKAGEVSAEILSVAREFKLPMSFPAEVLKEAHSIPVQIPEAEIRRRLDFRGSVCFTIDPEDAKDFDDAVSLEKIQGGDYRLGVHIADVSYYVNEETPLDKEALKRGTSVYFPNGVIPMLPEKLSNELCSLRPDEDRLAYSVFINLTPRGIVKGYEIRESVIRSKHRFSYEDVQRILDGKPDQKSPAEFIATVKEMHELSSTLTKKRMKEGSIDFDSAEAKFRFDAQGKPVEIIKKIRLESHRLVEEFMLLANRVVAQHIGLAKKEEHQKPFLYRIHDSPDPDRIRELSLFVQKFGFKLNVDGGVTSKSLQKLLSDVRGTEVENVINEVALRSMAKAIYSDRNIGHYGLAFDYYSHFTSPIRRYPDLVIHRLLKKYQQPLTAQEREELRKRLPHVAKQSSDMERLAMEAERAAVKVMQVEYMKRHLGDEFQAVVSGVTHFGMFVEVNDLLVEGMIHVRDLGDDYYVYDEKHYALVGRRTRKQYRLGDSISVKVVRVNPEERQIDFSLVEA